MAGQVLMTIADSGPMAGPLKAGKLRALAHHHGQAPPAFPDVPTMAEAGIADMEIALWTGIVAPAGTPRRHRRRCCRTRSADTLDMPEVRAALEAIAVDPRSTTVGRISAT